MKSDNIAVERVKWLTCWDEGLSGFPRLVESPGFCFFKIPGPRKSWKITLVLESPWNLSLRSWKVLENILENYALRHFCSEFWHLKLHQISYFRELCPGPRWESLQRSPRLPNWWRGARYHLPKNTTLALGSSGARLVFSLHLSIRGLRKGPEKLLMMVLESHGKVLDFLSVKEWEPWSVLMTLYSALQAHVWGVVLCFRTVNGSVSACGQSSRRCLPECENLVSFELPQSPSPQICVSVIVNNVLRVNMTSPLWCEYILNVGRFSVFSVCGWCLSMHSEYSNQLAPLLCNGSEWDTVWVKKNSP